MKLVPIGEFKFQNYDGLIQPDPLPPAHVDLTCKNHLTGMWSTKNPYQRSIHFLGWKEMEFTTKTGHKIPLPMHPELGWIECTCPFSDMLVITNEAQWREYVEESFHQRLEISVEDFELYCQVEDKDGTA